MIDPDFAPSPGFRFPEWRHSRRRRLIRLAAAVAMAAAAQARAMDLHQARVCIPTGASVPEQKACAMLVDEIAKHSRIRLPVVGDWPSGAAPIIALGAGPELPFVPDAVRTRLAAAPKGDEGFRVQAVDNVIVVNGNSPAATVFAAGWLLRHLVMDMDPMTEATTLETTGRLQVATSPRYKLRGFQFNYRDWTNAYDGWTPAMFEQYVRDMAVFGNNSVELMGPGPDNEKQSPHFPISKMEMLVQMSRIIDQYGMQVWIFFPIWTRDYSKQENVDSLLQEWAEVFKAMPRLDGVFVPGGDPGHTEPRFLMPILKMQAENLHRYHPKAQVWMTVQQFNAEWMDQFFKTVEKGADWLSGVGYHSFTRIPLPEFRRRLPDRYAVRLYPDITHSIQGEYPVPDWDTSLAITSGREQINPRPEDIGKIMRYALPHTVGSIAYSEGINDDVNKVVMNMLCWDPGMSVREIVREYARYFHGPDVETAITDGVFGLERNWRGPLLTNGGVDDTYGLFRSLERQASVPLLHNWRFQQLLYRAYFDYYVKTRLIYERSLEAQAMEKLREARVSGTLIAMAEARRILDRAKTEPIARDLRLRLHELAAQQFDSIDAQLSTDLYRAKAPNRGASLDTVDSPLNNRFWLELQFDKAAREPDELSRLEAIDRILNRTNPGPGGYYDDLGNPARQPHLVSGLPYAEDPASFESPRNSSMAFSGHPLGGQSVDGIRPDGPMRFQHYPIEWWDYEETRFECPLTLAYHHLDKDRQYRVRVVYVSRRKGEARVQLVTGDGQLVHPYLDRTAKELPDCTEAEYDIPAESTADGDLVLNWKAEPGSGGFGVGILVAEVFLYLKER